MPFGSKIFDKQLDESQWWTDCHFVPGAPPPVTQKLCVCVWLLLPVFVLFSLAAWLTGWIRANFTDIYIQRNIKHIKDFFFVFPLAARVQSTLSSRKWDTDPVFWLVSAGLLLAKLYEDVAARGFWELLLIWEFYFLTALFRDCRGKKAEALLCLISCTSTAQ